MFNPGKKAYAAAIIFIFLWFVISPIEYGNFRFSSIWNPLLWGVSGAALLWLLNNKRYKPIRVKLIVLSGIYLLVSCWSLFNSVFCRYGEESIVYVNKKNRANVVICRPYACFLTSDDCGYLISWTIAGDLRWTRKLYKIKFDAAKWERYYDASKNKYYYPK